MSAYLSILEDLSGHVGFLWRKGSQGWSVGQSKLLCKLHAFSK
jgi:hypothetical protein